jgi:hypothetical protein
MTRVMEGQRHGVDTRHGSERVESCTEYEEMTPLPQLTACLLSATLPAHNRLVSDSCQLRDSSVGAWSTYNTVPSVHD